MSGCGYYSFTGATIPERLNTIAVPLALDESANPLATLGDDLTELLIERFVQQTRLSLEPDDVEADAVLAASIERYRNEPTSVSGNERATVNRVTITVAVRYYDNVEDRELLSRTFSSFGEYDPLQGGLDDERVAALAALENIADDIFTAATSDW